MGSTPMSADALIGNTLAHYRVVERLGSGGMGDVYRAEDLRLRRIVALKTLRADDDSDGGTQRLLAEARAASALNHPHIAVVYEIGQGKHEGQPLDYIAMEFVEGTTLHAMMQAGRSGPRYHPRHLRADCGCHRGGRAPRDRSPRPQAGQRHGHTGRTGEGPRLRRRPAPRRDRALARRSDADGGGAASSRPDSPARCRMRRRNR